MNWQFWKKTNIQANSSYENAVVTALFNAAIGTSAKQGATAGVEVSTGLISRAFASATVKSESSLFTDALTPDVLSNIARNLLRCGESVYQIVIEGGRVRLQPAGSWDVRGGPDERLWFYRMDTFGPSGSTTHYVPSASALHCRYAYDPSRPWLGMGPLQFATLTGKLSAETAKMLGDLSSGPRGSVMPMPDKDGADETLTELKADLKTLGGGMSFVESMSSGMGTADMRQGNEDWRQKHIMAAPEQALVDLNRQAFDEVLACYGLSPVLFEAKPGNGSRESYRQLYFSTILPLGKLVQAELRSKLHPSISLTFEAIAAADVVAKARALKGMVDSGVDLEKALGLSGLMATDDDA